MNNQLHGSQWARIEHWLIWVAVLVLLLFFLAPRAGSIDRVAVAPTVESRASPSEPVLPVLVLPFSAADAVHYFSTVLEMSPEKAANGVTVFENYQVAHPEDRWRIAVSTEGKGVVVEFTVGGDYGLTLAREFFECPIFVRTESEEFYAMLGDARNAPVKKMRRFTVAMTFAQTTDLEMLVMRFTPRDAS